MILTHTPIDELLDTGNARHSPIAEIFIRQAQSRFGMCVIACYLQSHTQIDLPPGMPFARFVRTKPIPFVRERILTLYTDSRRSSPCTEQTKEELYALLFGILRQAGIFPQAPRLYLPEEMQYYGWLHTKREEWDFGRVVETADPLRESHCVCVEEADKLALWRILQDGLGAVKRCPVLAETGARLFCGHDPLRDAMAYWLVFPERDGNRTARNAAADEIAQLAWERLRIRDPWGVITAETVRPVVTDAASLTPEQRRSFGRG